MGFLVTVAWANLPEVPGQQLPGEVAGAGGWTWGPVLAGKKFTCRQCGVNATRLFSD